MARIVSRPQPAKPTVEFRPDSRDNTKTFRIHKHIAEQLYREGKIAQDITNGGYCPSSMRYGMAIHKVR